VTSPDMTLEASPIAAGEVVKLWLLHLLSLFFPLASLAFLWTGPHKWWVAPLFIIPLGFMQYLDTRPIEERRQPADSLPSWPFSLTVYLLAALQFLVVFEMVRMFSQQTIFSADMLMVFVIVGGTSGFSIITAHELIHRRNKADQLLGRLLLCTVLYEHFYTEHLRGHHVRVGTSEDPATARFGERFNAFYRRTVPAQFRSAWRLECRRLGDAEMGLFDARILGNRIVHGIVVGWGMAFAVLYFYGASSFFAFLLQAFVAVRLLEAVNYFEHWGLSRSGRRVKPTDSWDTHSWITYHGLVGLSRHADHHAYPSRPYEQLRVWDEAPLLPVGYVGLVDMVLTRNDDFIAIATEELERRRLGPFAEGAEGAGAAEAQGAAQGSEAEPPVELPDRGDGGGLAAGVGRLFRSLPKGVGPVLLIAGLTAFVTFGGALESGFEMSFVQGFVRNGLILAVVAVSLFMQSWLQRKAQNGWIAWGAAITLFVALARLSEPLIGV
jgi:alkane 1-monooxygenase